MEPLGEDSGLHGLRTESRVLYTMRYLSLGCSATPGRKKGDVLFGLDGNMIGAEGP